MSHDYSIEFKPNGEDNNLTTMIVNALTDDAFTRAPVHLVGVMGLATSTTSLGADGLVRPPETHVDTNMRDIANGMVASGFDRKEIANMMTRYLVVPLLKHVARSLEYSYEQLIDDINALPHARLVDPRK